MIYGTTAKVLRVDLSASKIEIQELNKDFYRLYPGGKALAGYILLTEMAPGVDPLGPENVLVLAKWFTDRRAGFNHPPLCRLGALTPDDGLWRIGSGWVLGTGAENGWV